MLDILIILGGAVYAGFSAMREQTPVSKAKAARGLGLPAAAERRMPVPSTSSSAYQTLDANKADHYLTVAGAALGASVLALALPPAGLVAAALLTYLSVPLYKAATIGLLVDRKPRSSMVGTVLTVASLTSGYYVLTAGCSLALFASFKLMLKTQAGSGRRVARVLSNNPQRVWLSYGEAEVEVLFESLKAGDVIVLRAGELVPIDGTVVQGLATVDQRTLTGESHEIEKAPGDALLASTTVVAGKLHVRVEKTGEQTTVANVQRVLRNTADYTATVEQKAGEFCDHLAGPTLLAGGATALMLSPVSGVALIGCNLSEVNRATTPLSMLNYLDLSATRGILIKDGRSLEVLSMIDTVVFDKTGTLTLDQPHVGRIECFGDLDEAAVLGLAAAAGTRQPHPVARAVVTAALDRGLTLPTLEHARYEIGYGVKVSTEGHTVHFGSARFMAREGIRALDEASLATVREAAEENGHSLVFVAQDGTLVGAIVLHSTLRPEAATVVERLRARGMDIYIVSGDAEEPTYRLADELGIKHFHANVLPEEKARIIRRLREQGRSICFVGDGINDAVALKTANVGISLSGSSNAALDTAGIILLNRDLRQLETLLDLAAAMERDQQRGHYATLIPGAIGATGVLFFGMGLPAALLLDMLGIGVAVGTAMWPKLHPRSVQANVTAGGQSPGRYPARPQR